MKQEMINRCASFMNEVRRKSEGKSIKTYSEICSDFHFPYGILKHMVTLGYLSKLDRGKYISNYKVAEPFHARKVLEKMNGKPKRSNVIELGAEKPKVVAPKIKKPKVAKAPKVAKDKGWVVIFFGIPFIGFKRI